MRQRLRSPATRRRPRHHRHTTPSSTLIRRLRSRPLRSSSRARRSGPTIFLRALASGWKAGPSGPSRRLRAPLRGTTRHRHRRRSLRSSRCMPRHRRWPTRTPTVPTPADTRSRRPPTQKDRRSWLPSPSSKPGTQPRPRCRRRSNRRPSRPSRLRATAMRPHRKIPVPPRARLRPRRRCRRLAPSPSGRPSSIGPLPLLNTHLHRSRSKRHRSRRAGLRRQRARRCRRQHTAARPCHHPLRRLDGRDRRNRHTEAGRLPTSHASRRVCRPATARQRLCPRGKAAPWLLSAARAARPSMQRRSRTPFRIA